MSRGGPRALAPRLDDCISVRVPRTFAAKRSASLAAVLPLAWRGSGSSPRPVPTFFLTDGRGNGADRSTGVSRGVRDLVVPREPGNIKAVRPHRASLRLDAARAGVVRPRPGYRFRPLTHAREIRQSTGVLHGEGQTPSSRVTARDEPRRRRVPAGGRAAQASRAGLFVKPTSSACLPSRSAPPRRNPRRR